MSHAVALAPSLSALPTFTVAAAIFILGLIVIARERPSAVSLSFFALTVSVSIWLIGISLTLMSVDARGALFFSRLAYIGVAAIPAAVLHFTIALLDEAHRRRVAIVACWITSAVFAALFTSTNLLIGSTWHYKWGFYPHLNEASAAFLVYFAIVLAASLEVLVRKELPTDTERRRNAAFLAALAVGYIGSVDYLPAFGISLYPIGCVAILGFIVLSAHAILRYRLSDLSPAFVAAQMLQTVQGGVIVVDTHGRIRVANTAAAQLLGYTLPEIRGADLCELLQVPTLPSTDSDSFIRRAVSRNRPAAWARKDGEEIELSVSAMSLRNGGVPVGVLYAISDLSDRRRAERNEFSATHDTLTRLPNRVRFADAFREMSAVVTETGRVAGVFFLDLDGFKAVNDRYGHPTGDSLLQIVASRLRNAVRGDDVIARYGGDEFVLLLNLARVADGETVANKLLRVIGEPFLIAKERISISASIGAAFYPRDGVDVESLIAAADSAMYSAKSEGKSRLHVVAPRHDVALKPPFGIDARA
jgi:diguanylate cyclase (GGDEF)-like protein/PAS domain S-box-containing protein